MTPTPLISLLNHLGMLARTPGFELCSCASLGLHVPTQDLAFREGAVLGTAHIPRPKTVILLEDLSPKSTYSTVCSNSLLLYVPGTSVRDRKMPTVWKPSPSPSVNCLKDCKVCKRALRKTTGI